MRTFIAVNLPADIKRGIGTILSRLRPIGPPASWVQPDNAHITLKFLGEVQETRIPAIMKGIRLAVDATEPLELSMGQCGAFPDPTRARVFWIGIERGAEALGDVSRAIDFQMSRLGFEREKRAFSAHLTLARLRQPASIERLVEAAKQVDYHFPTVKIAQIDLMKSVLSTQGATYSVLDSASFKAE
ncbi:MAG TPA: RNA 2',3'-cyclic phosphodiesterase [candidate division Zixibacteria bacterium]|jgi:2'-5' RNA ligase